MPARHLERSLAVVVSACVLGVSGVARAAPRSVAVYVEGPGADALEPALLAAMPKDVALADASSFRAAFGRRQHGPFGKQLDGKGLSRAVTRLLDSAHDAGASGVVVVRLAKAKKDRKVLLLSIAEGGNIEINADLDLPARATSNDGAVLVSALGDTLKKYTKEAAKPAPDNEVGEPPPPSSEPAPAVESAARAPTPSEGPDQSKPTHSSAWPLVELELGGGVAGRHFGYKDGLTPNLRTYNLFPAPLVSARAQVFPLVGARGIVSDIGLIGSYEQLPLVSSTVDGASLSSTLMTFFVGPRARIHPGADAGPQIGLAVTYAHAAFTFASPPTRVLAAQLPNETYDAIRPAVDGRVPFGPVSILATAAFRFVLGADGASARLRQPGANGIDAEVGASVAVTEAISIRVLASYERYFFAFKPVPGDAYVAGGALDELYGGRLALAYAY